MSQDWQKKLRYRGFRLLGWSLPLLLLSLGSASLIPRRPPLILAEDDVSSSKKNSGLLTLPYGKETDLPLTLELNWTERPARDARLNLLVTDRSGSNRIQKKIAIKPIRRSKVWQQNIEIRLTSTEIHDYTLLIQSKSPMLSHFRWIAFAAPPAARYFRIGEMLYYPALAFIILAMSMVLFPSFIRS